VSNLTLFDYIDRIKMGRDVPEDDDFKEYNPFMAVRILSMNLRNLPGADYLNQYTFLKMTKRQHFELMKSLPWDRTFAKYIKGEKEKVSGEKELVDAMEKAWKGTTVKRYEIVEALRNGILTQQEIGTILAGLGIDDKKRKRLLKAANQMKKENV